MNIKHILDMPMNIKSSNTVAPALTASEQMIGVRFQEGRCDFTPYQLKYLSIC
jgi:hypothetical protein